MKNKWKLTLLIALGGGICSAYAQESTNTSGGNASGIGGSASYSIGQVAYTYENGINGNSNQGVQQPYEIFSAGVEEDNTHISLIAYPNPTSGILNLQFEDYKIFESSIHILDINGKLLFTNYITNSSTSVDLSEFSSGTYLVNITSQSRIIKTFKILKK